MASAIRENPEMTSPVRDALHRRVEAALAEVKAAADFDHPGLVGAARELLVAQLLRPLTGPEVEYGTGKLVDVDGGLSLQVDIILNAPSTTPPALTDAASGLGFYPVEGCLYTIEVKSRLDRTELRKAVTGAEAICSLHPLPNVLGGIPRPTPLPVRALFALSSDTSNPETEFARMIEEMKLLPDNRPVLGVLCVVGVGYWYWGPAREEGSPEGWHYAPADGLTEICDFLAGLVNTVPDLIYQKGTPRFGHYLVTPREFVFRGFDGTLGSE